MSQEGFMLFLQEIITMTDKNNPYSIAYGKNLLKQLADFVILSEKVDSITYGMMMGAIRRFDFIMENKENFAGIPGDYQRNQAMRNRLAMMLRPGC